MRPGRSAWIIAVVAAGGFFAVWSLSRTRHVKKTPTPPVLGVTVEQDLSRHVDSLLEDSWRERGIVPAGRAGDAEFLRRVSLDLRGTVATKEEVRGFLDDASPEKRDRVVREFLASQESADYFARIMTETLMGTEPLQAVRPEVLRLWLREAYLNNRPWDALVLELLMAEHPRSWYGPTNFILRWNFSPKELAGTTSRIFLGTQIQCAECHDHPTDSWTREDFYGFVAFFTETEREKINLQRLGLDLSQKGLAFRMAHARGNELFFDPETGTYSVDVLDLQAPDMADPMSVHGRAESRPRGDADPESGGLIEEALSRRAEKDRRVIIPPKFPGKDPIVGVQDRPRRHILAELVVTEGRVQLARTHVNRLFAQLFGKGLVDPVDDFSLANPPSHPELLTFLTDVCLESGFDTRKLLRILAGTDAYQLGSDAPDDGSLEDAFARGKVRQLNPHQLFLSILTVTESTSGRVHIPEDPRARKLYDVLDDIIARWRAHAESPTSRPPQVLMALDTDERIRTARGGHDLPVGILDPTVLDPREIARREFVMTLRNDASGSEPLEGAQQSLQQLLLVMNGLFTNDRISVDATVKSGTVTTQIEDLFLATLNRWPGDSERQWAEDAMAATSESSAEIMEDLLWSLMNTTEFLCNH